MTRHLKNQWTSVVQSKQSGVIVILLAILLPVLFGFMALAIDIGYLFLTKNRMQVAADSAALVAASSIQNGQGIISANDWALTATSANSFTNGVDSTTVTVNVPPGGTESYAQNASYVKVTVQHTTPTFLAGFFGVMNMLASASAVAGPAGGGNPCVLALDSTSNAALNVQGSAKIFATGCGIYVNSSSINALECTGKSNQFTANVINVVGGIDTNKCQTSTSNSVKVSAPITVDPFIDFPLPDNTKLPCNPIDTSKNPISLTSGTYCGTTINSKTLNMAAGTYVIYGGGLTLKGSSTLNGAGVTIYNTGAGTSGKNAYGSINLTGTGGVNLSAPTAGKYAGMLIYQDSLNSLPATIGAGSTMVILNGNIYFPNSKFTLAGGNTDTYPIGSVIAKTIDFGGTNFYITNKYGATGTTGTRSAIYE